MASPLLATKFHVPRRRRGLVARPRLTERLSRAAESTLTLVSAPAGFGKSTLLAEWFAAEPTGGRSVAWLALDQRDNDPTMFWTYLVTAVRTAAPAVGAGALSMLQSAQPPIEAVLSLLLNDLSSADTDIVLVLDDYHLIDKRDIHEGIGFLLEHLPHRVQLVIAGRSDPPLPLGRMRGRGELVEIRAADLRFTPEEATAYLTDVMGLVLTAQDVAALEGRTEGWIAALQLAALSLQGRDDVAAFIAGFAGDDRYIVDYLAEEVLLRQSDDVQEFLLRTSILDRLVGPLCDAVTGRIGGRAQLAALERGNLFLVPLDDQRRWYRYHQLFADVLQAHLRDEQPEIIPDLHRRASGWFSEHGEPADAISHALAANDFDRAADLVERAIPAMRQSRQETALHAWLTMLPDDVVRVRPVLTVGFAGAMLAVGQLEGVEARLLDGERMLAGAADLAAGVGLIGEGGGSVATIVVADDGEYRRLPATIELYRAAQALAHGDLPASAGHAQRAQDLSPEDDHLVRAAAAGLLGLAHWATGDLEAGHAAYADCMAGLYRAGHVADTFGCAIALADIRLAQGRLGDALRTYEQALQRAGDQGQTALRGTADMYIGMSEVARERNDLVGAAALVRRGEELGEHTGLPQNPYRSRVALARIRQSAGDFAAALELLDAAERHYVGDYFPNVRPISALRARVWADQGDFERALDWAQQVGVSVDDELGYLREFEHITLARVLIAMSATGQANSGIEQATELLTRLLRAAEDGARTGSAIEIRALQALALQARGDVRAALRHLERSLAAAEPEGYVRMFVDEGAPMARLLRAAADHDMSPGYVHRLRTALDRTEPGIDDRAPTGRSALITPLSDRELDVLRLLGTDLNGPDIARRLFLSLNTIRTHTKSIYAKLAVTNRRAAVRRAQELDLF